MICSYCSAPIRAGDERWAGREPEEFWHYRCAEVAQLAARINPFGFTPLRDAERLGRLSPVRSLSTKAAPSEHEDFGQLLEAIRHCHAIIEQELDPAARERARRLLAEAEEELRASVAAKEPRR